MARYSEEILDIINQSYEHYTAEQIYSVMKNRGDKIVLATVTFSSSCSSVCPQPAKHSKAANAAAIKSFFLKTAS